MILLSKLILAHLLGDFILQPHAWVKAKERKKLASYPLYLHAGLHGLLIMLLVWDLQFWIWALLLAVVHLIIDTVKLYLQREETKRKYFFLDQLAHLVSIVGVWMIYQSIPADPRIFLADSWILITLVIFLTTPVSMIVKTFISKWTPTTKEEDGSLQEAGKYIGILERLFVFIFIICGRWEAIGFLVTAKSVFRFGDLRQSQDRKLTEYVLIGTLLSFGIAMLVGLVYMKLEG